jgi:small subunit ribosomal protein S11
MKKPKTVKKKIRTGPLGHVNFYVQATFNNTIVTATDRQGNVLAWATAGSSGFKGTKKSTPFAGQSAMNQVLHKLPLSEISSANLFIKGVGSGRDAAPRALAAKRIPVTKIRDITPLPHNGPRAKKPRRV